MLKIRVKFQKKKTKQKLTKWDYDYMRHNKINRKNERKK